MTRQNSPSPTAENPRVVTCTATYDPYRFAWSTTLETGTTITGYTLHALQEKAAVRIAMEMGLPAGQVRVQLHFESPTPTQDDPKPIGGYPEHDKLNAIFNLATQARAHEGSSSVVLDENGHLNGYINRGRNIQALQAAHDELMAAMDTLPPFDREKFAAEEEAMNALRNKPNH